MVYFRILLVLFLSCFATGGAIESPTETFIVAKKKKSSSAKKIKHELAENLALLLEQTATSIEELAGLQKQVMKSIENILENEKTGFYNTASAAEVQKYLDETQEVQNTLKNALASLQSYKKILSAVK